jgi:hypothetical protein
LKAYKNVSDFKLYMGDMDIIPVEVKKRRANSFGKHGVVCEKINTTLCSIAVSFSFLAPLAEWEFAMTNG